MINISDFKDVQITPNSKLDRNLSWEWKNILTGKIPGACIECGVYKGASIISLAEAFPEEHFYGFDTFEGVPEIWDKGTNYNIDMEKFATKKPSNIPSNITLINGLVEDTLPKWLNSSTNNVSFLHLDMDIYKSTYNTLKILNSRIVEGTLIRFDELADWKYLGYSVFDKDYKGRRKPPYTNWEEHEWKALLQWIKEDNRQIFPVARDERFSAWIRVEC